MSVRAVRGATQLEADDREQMLDRVAELVLAVMEANALEVDDFISVVFTATGDLHAEFPAYAARRLGFGEIPLTVRPRARDRGLDAAGGAAAGRTSSPSCRRRRSPTSTFTAPRRSAAT